MLTCLYCTIMKKQKIHIEKELNCKSANIIWPLLNSAGGLAKWVADYVERDDDQLTFTWGEAWTHQETRTATITEEVAAHHLKMTWNEEEDPDAYWLMEIERSEITGDFILIITDFAWEEDVDGLYDIWERNFEKLHQTTGL